MRNGGKNRKSILIRSMRLSSGRAVLKLSLNIVSVFGGGSIAKIVCINFFLRLLS